MVSFTTADFCTSAGRGRDSSGSPRAATGKGIRVLEGIGRHNDKELSNIVAAEDYKRMARLPPKKS